MTRRFVVIGQTATASGDFLLGDIPGTSGRLDVLLRCVRAALLVSHGLRRDAVIYLVLLGGDRAPRTLRLDGAGAKYLRPDERSLAVTLQKALRFEATSAFTEYKPGIALCAAGIDAVLDDLGDAALCVLDEGGEDLRACGPELTEYAWFLGDHRGFDPHSLARLRARGARFVSVGPVSVQADDVIALVSNELDRREAVHSAVDSR